MKVYDLHNDVLTERRSWAIKCSQYEKCGKITCAVFRGERSLFETLNICDNFLKKCYTNLRLAFEDIGYTERGAVNLLLKYKPKYISLTWNGENYYGYGCNSNLPLKNAGLKLVKKLEKQKVTIDVAHLSQRGFYNVVDNCYTLINSHTAFASVFKHKRSITDEQIELIVEKNGIIGLCFVGDFLCGGKASVSDLVRHIDYYVQKYPYRNLCIGSDLNGSDNIVKGLKNYSDFDKLVENLLKLGYNEKIIADIFYNNALRFWGE